MKCSCCGAADLVADIRDLPYTYKDKSTSIPAVTGNFCPACGECIADIAESERIMRAMRAFSLRVNSLG